MGYSKRDSACELSTFGPTVRTKIIEPLVITDYPKQGITFLVGLGNIPTSFKRYVMKANFFLIYLKRGIAHPLSNFGHK
jgi:hypothetical protein